LILPLSKLGIGGNQFGRVVGNDAAVEIMAAALDEGANLVDTAEAYADGASEQVIGEALRRLGRRNDMVVATKFSPASDPIEACEASLIRLQTDRIDLYQMHAPNPAVPIEETLGALSRLVESGKVLTIGCSNFAGWQIADADWTARTRGLPRFQTAQNRYSLVEREAEKEIVPACLHLDLGLMPYYPLAAGLLTGKYRRGYPPAEGTRLATSPIASSFLSDALFDRLEGLEKFAAARSVSLLSVAIGGLAAMPAVVTVITGVVSTEQVRANAKAARWIPSEEDLKALPYTRP
jgi:aryl-alcohol dehydrogenase-like predicted oxidoreductase